ncbi:hypothetical protein VTL71DRAFT_4316 [Oculimacula yallundae]|uniref:Uncharacterized protein n=1 Tax=Oculimacula yallundae TaxID=86028 RepID=A0ABR4C5F5_9HELO
MSRSPQSLTTADQLILRVLLSATADRANYSQQHVWTSILQLWPASPAPDTRYSERRSMDGDCNDMCESYLDPNTFRRILGKDGGLTKSRQGELLSSGLQLKVDTVGSSCFGTIWGSWGSSNCTIWPERFAGPIKTCMSNRRLQ